MGRLNEGQNMPDFSFRTPFCPKLTLKEFMAGQKTAIVFLRYLAARCASMIWRSMRLGMRR